MAYGNYGAIVKRNGERVESMEDQVPYSEDGPSGYGAMFLRGDGFGRPAGSLGPHHAVMGSGPVRFCGYKCWPVLLVNGESVDLEERFVQQRDSDGSPIEWAGEIEGFRFYAVHYDNNMLDIELTEPDGTAWCAKCGYGYGAGFE
jgi:hypothetical protein